MKLIYRIVSELFLLISPILILYRILKGKENINRFPERYAINSKKRLPGKLIWFHCSSVGELLSIIPLVEKLELSSKVKQILITTTTLSSSKIFETLKLKKTVHQFFPIDNFLIIEKFLNYWEPSILFLCESEIWPNLINKVKHKKIKLILLNARMTLRSFEKWKKIKNFSNEIFNKFDKCFSQNNETFKRLKMLGVEKIYNIGNLKFSTSKNVKNEFLDKKTSDFLKNKKILITAASTHFNEENFIIQNHLYFKFNKNFKNLISLIIPRHIERADEIKKEVEKFSLKVHLRSSGQIKDSNIDVFIIDTYGELNKFYRVSGLVFMGGSLIKHGGQNPLEPAKFGCKIIHGPNIYNFNEIYKKLNTMKISKQFLNYNKGIKIIENSLNKKKLKLDNKNIIQYGEKILNSTYFEIIKLI